MAQLIVRDIEEKVVRKLKQRAGEHGISTEEEHRRILSDALFPPKLTKLSFKDHLKRMPEIPEEFLRREDDRDRDVEL